MTKNLNLGISHSSEQTGPMVFPVISSIPPFNAKSKVLGRLHLAPKYCISLPILMADTQQAIPLSYWALMQDLSS